MVYRTAFLKKVQKKQSISGKAREVLLVAQVVYSLCMKNDQYLQSFLNKAHGKCLLLVTVVCLSAEQFQLVFKVWGSHQLMS